MLGTLLKIGKMGIKEYLQYKSMLFIFTLNRIIEVVVYIFVWYAIYNQTGQIEGFAINEIATYYILVVTLVPMSLWGVNEDIAYSIRKGYITRELLNPISYFTYYFGKELGEMGFGLLTAICTFIVCNIFWTVLMPVNIWAFIGFICILLLNIPISYFLQMIVGTCGFYTDATWGMQILRKSIISIFSGLIAPLTMFPVAFQKIANILPFKEFFYTPINIYLGKIQGIEIIWIIVKQLIWVLVMYLLAKVFFNKAVKKVTINGG